MRETLLKDGYRRLVVGGEARDIDDVRPSEATARRGIARGGRRSPEARRARQLRRLDAGHRGGVGRAATGERHRLSRRATAPRARRAAGLVCPTCARELRARRGRASSRTSRRSARARRAAASAAPSASTGTRSSPTTRKSLEKGAIRPWTGKSSEWERERARASFAKRSGIPLDVPWATLTARAARAGPRGRGRPGTAASTRACARGSSGSRARTYKMHVRVLLARYRAYDRCATPATAARLNADGAALPRRRARSRGVARARARARRARGSTRSRTRTGAGRARARASCASRLALPRARRARLPRRSIARRARSRAARRSACRSPRRSARRSPARSSCSTSRPSACTRRDVPPLVDAMRELARARQHRARHRARPARRRAPRSRGRARARRGRRTAGSIVLRRHARGARAADRPADRARARRARAQRAARAAHAARASSSCAARARTTCATSTSSIPLGVLVRHHRARAARARARSSRTSLYRALARALGRARRRAAPARYDAHRGREAARSASMLVDQSPLGRTSRGNAATYTKAWDRDARALRRRARGAARAASRPAHFSFNVAGGRCEACSGEGYETVEMQFLADVRSLCPVCRGKRFKRRGARRPASTARRVADVLAMTVDEALARLRATTRAHRRARSARSRALGLGYLPLGQPLSTLSGGEAQRLKLARALGRARATGTLFVLDEPSAGLHAERRRARRSTRSHALVRRRARAWSWSSTIST